MSDNLKVIGIGGAGVNSIQNLDLRNKLLVDSARFKSLEDVKNFIEISNVTNKSIIVSSPAGEFSSSVLPTVCSTLHSRGENVYLISIMPFFNESPERKKRGERTLKTLKKNIDTLVVIENENFASSMIEHTVAEMFSRINSHICSLVKDFSILTNVIPDARRVGLFTSSGNTLEDLEKNIIFTSNLKNDGMVGIATFRSLEEYQRLVNYFPVDFVYSDFGDNLSISGVTLFDSQPIGNNPGLPSELCSHREI
jgi:hypothetical protein